MLFSLLPTTALATGDYPAANVVSVDNGKNFAAGKLYFRNGEEDCSSDSTNFNAYYEPTTGTLTLNGYNGKGISVGGALHANITVKLVGTNTINGGVLESSVGGDITITSDSKGTLSITHTLNGGNDAIGIKTGLSSSHTTGNVTIKGDAKVTIIVTHNGTNGYDNAYGIYAKENITISEDASVDITCATPNNTTGGYNCNGLVASNKVIIDTNGEIKINVKNAGGDDAYSYGIFPTNGATLTKVGNMEVKWKKHASVSWNSGGVITGSESFSDTDHAINVDKPNCYASYRYGTPRTVEVVNGTVTGPGVLNAESSGKFLENDTVSITPYERKGKSGETIPFKGWTPSDVTLNSPATTANNSFTVPAKNVTVTAKHDPFDGAPTFTPTGSNDTDGTLTFKTVVRLGDGTECFYLVKDGEQNDESKYISFRPDNSPSTSPYEYNYETRTLPGVNQVEAGDYYVVELLNGKYYLSEKFTVDYTAAPVPTATVDDVTIEGVKDSLITNQEVTIKLTNDKFASMLSGNWITNLPNGLSQSVSRTDNTHAKITVSGNPSVTSSAALTIKIPKANLASNADLTVTSNENAVFAITTPITETLVPVTDLSKTYIVTAQEPTFGGSLIRDTDYTVSYAVKSGSTGNLDSDNKPVDAGTYLVTVTGKGSYTGNFTVEFTIDKAAPVYTPPTAKTGLTYNSSALELITAGSVSKGGEMQYKLDGGSYGTTIPTATDAGNYAVYYQIAANDNYNAVTEMQVGSSKINIAPANQSAPTGLGVAAPTASGDNGKITGTTTAMEYSTDSGFTSPAGTTCTDTATEVAPGTYYVRLKADANHNAGTVSAALVVPAYSATKYTVTVKSDSNGTASADKTTDVVAGETVTLTATPNSGYVFDKWADKTPNSLTIGADGKFTMPSENVSVKATFKGTALTGTASITGNLKFNEELTASLAGTNNTGTLTYKWYRSGETAEIVTNNTGKYTLVEDDIGKIITVEITSSAQTGKINGSTTGTIEKADGPAAPSAFTLSFTLNSDGKTFTATIPTVVGGEYSFDGSTYSPTNTKNNCTANTTYTGYARVKETATHKASTATNSTQTAPKLTVATPTFTPNGVSSFSGTQSVTIACDTAGAKIYYTTDGTEPTVSGIEYKTALTLTSTTTLKAIAVKADMNDSAIATATFTKASGGGGGSGGGSYVPKTQKPEIKAAAGGKTVLSKDGTTLTITADAGKVIDKVLLNGKDMGAVSELKGLKTGDKVEVIFKDQVTEPTKEELDKAAKEAAGDLVLTARSAKLKNGSVKVMLKGDLKAITDAGYTVKYKFYRSTKKSAGYKAVLTKKAPSYVNTYGKKGTMYYYKAKVMIYDKEGNFVAQTALKQCKYANRLWTK